MYSNFKSLIDLSLDKNAVTLHNIGVKTPSKCQALSIRICLLFFIGVALFSCQPKKEKATDRSNRIIKSVLESTYDPIGKRDEFEYSSTVSENSFIYQQVFNRKGALQVESRFDSKGNLDSKAVFKYDNNGNNVQLDFYKPDGSIESKVTSKFDSNNKLIERLEANAEDKLISKQMTNLDSNANRIVTTYQFAKGKFIKTLECVFDKRNQNVANNYFTNAILESKSIYLYNFNGERIRDSYSTGFIQKTESAFERYHSTSDDYHYDENLKSSDQNRYNEEGNRTETIQYFPFTNKQIITQYKYNKNKIEVTTLTASLMVSSKLILIYDDQNNLIESFRYGIGGRLQEHQRHLYEYDPSGNWIKHKTIINNKSISVAIRQIEYY